MYSAQTSTENYFVKAGFGTSEPTIVLGNGAVNAGWNAVFESDIYVTVGGFEDVKNSITQLYANLGGLRAEYYRDTVDLDWYGATPWWVRKDATVNFSTNQSPSSAVKSRQFLDPLDWRRYAANYGKLHATYVFRRRCPCLGRWPARYQ